MGSVLTGGGFVFGHACLALHLRHGMRGETGDCNVLPPSCHVFMWGCAYWGMLMMIIVRGEGVCVQWSTLSRLPQMLITTMTGAAANATLLLCA